MELSPELYHWFVRSKWFTGLYIHNHFEDKFDFNNKSVLDFGSGIGSCSSMFDPKNYIGVDCDAKRVNYARKIHPGYTFSVLQGYSLPLPENSMDYILIVAVLHHIYTKDIPYYIQEFHRVIKPDGKILIIEPCLSKHFHFNNLFMKMFDRGKYILDEDEYLSLFTNNNFEVQVNKRYTQLLLYNKIFFSAVPKY